MEQAAAITTNWNTNSTGSYTNAANWSGGIPTAADTAVFNRNLNIEYGVTFPGRPILSPLIREAKQLKIGTNAVNFSDIVNFNQLPASLKIDAANTLLEDALIIGDTAGQVATLTSTLSDFSTSTVTIGNAAGSTGTLNLNGGALNVTHANPNGLNGFHLADQGVGTLNVNGGSQLIVAARSRLASGSNSSATATIAGAGSKWQSSLIYNGHGAATISVLAGGSIVSGEFVLAGDSSLLVSGPGSNISGEYFLSVATTFSNHAVADFDYAQFIGELVVDGIGTTVTANETFRIFESGSIRNGGQVVSTGSTLVGGSLIDNSPEPQPGDPYPGNLEIDGVGSQLISGPFGVRVAGTFPQSSLILNNGGSVSGSVFNSGTVSGSGTITGSISNGGIVKPKLLHINDSFNQSDGGRLQFEIGGTTPIEHGRLVVDDMLALNGSLDILLVDGFVPQPGDTFDLLDFGSVFVNGLNLNAALPAPLSWDTTRLFSEGIIKAILPGDYNDNGTVDAADYVVWRKQIVSNPGQMLPNDGTPFVGSDDYTTWRANFGNVAPSGSASSVPEPLGPAMAYTIALCIPLFRFRVVWCV